jgi:hypothetical protein
LKTVTEDVPRGAGRRGFRRPDRTAAVCRHLKIAGRVALVTVFSDYQPPPPKLQHILDRLLAAAYGEGALLAAAGASEDAPRLWEIRVDTIAGARRRGLAALVVWQLTARLLRDGIAPYYSTLISNVVSQRVAQRVGYWPAWIEMEARLIRR